MGVPSTVETVKNSVADPHDCSLFCPRSWLRLSGTKGESWVLCPLSDTLAWPIGLPSLFFSGFFSFCTCEGAMTASLCTALMSGRTLGQQGSFNVTDACTWTSRRKSRPLHMGWACQKNGWQGFKRECIPGRKAPKRATRGTRTRAFLWSSLRHPEHHSRCSSGLQVSH